jgi:hypothetical protein
MYDNCRSKRTYDHHQQFRIHLEVPRFGRFIVQTGRFQDLLTQHFYGFFVSPASARDCRLAFLRASMGEWLLKHFAVFGLEGQNWMLIALVIILLLIALSWWSWR